MISRLVVRTVLVSIITALTGVLWWAWTADFENIAQRVLITIIAGSVMIATLSLLFESFLSFGTISVERRSWKYFLSGLYMFDKNKKTPSVNARTCELFGVRSVTLSMFSVLTAMFLTILYQAAKAAALFLFDPHVPAINWHETLSVIGMIAVAIPSALLLFGGHMLILKKISIWQSGSSYRSYTGQWLSECSWGR